MAELIDVLSSESGVDLNRSRLSQIKGISFLDDGGGYVFTGTARPFPIWTAWPIAT